MAPGVGCAVSAESDGIASGEFVDEPSVRINSDHPKHVPLQGFVGRRVPILQKARFPPCADAAGAACNEQDFGPINTGPFA